MTRKEYDAICEKVGGEEVLRLLLTEIAKIKKLLSEKILRRHLELGSPLFEFFEHRSEFSENLAGDLIEYKRGPYLSVCVEPNRIDLTYGISVCCFTGEGREYPFIKNHLGKWLIDPEGEYSYWVN